MKLQQTILLRYAPQYDIAASRIRHGVPVGGELEMVDGTTLSHSYRGTPEDPLLIHKKDLIKSTLLSI